MMPLDEPMLIVERKLLLRCIPQLRHPIALRSPHKGCGRLDTQEGDLRLKVITHLLAAMVMA